MKILLHICCAPCTIFPLKELSRDGKDSVTGFFYNPNIHPSAEMEKRLKALEDYARQRELRVIYGDYDSENFFKRIGGDTHAPARCRICWEMRLTQAAKTAKEQGFDAFTSTLLVSPYQDRREMVTIGSRIAAEFGITFLDDDWRGGFREAQQEARERDIYRQKYCGCVFSEKERARKKKI